MRLIGLLVGVLIAAGPMTVKGQREFGCMPVRNGHEYTGIPAEVDVYEIRVIDATSDSVEALMGGGDLKQQMFVSDDRGQHWKPSTVVKETFDGLMDVSGASRSAVLYRSLRNGAEILRSFDGGRTWSPAKLAVHGMEHERGSIQIGINGISHNGATLYASVQRPHESSSLGFERIPGIYISRDYGDNWAISSLTLPDESPIAVGDLNSNLLFGVESSGLVRSRDAGKTWTPVGQQAELTRPLLLRGRQKEVERLITSGQAVPDNLRKGVPNNVYQIEITEDNHTVYVLTSGGLLISHDLGNSWCRSEVGMNVADVINGLAISSTNSAQVFLSTRRTVKARSILYYSSDAGRHFKSVYYAIGVASAKKR